MTVFATWVPADLRFAFSLDQGEHRLTHQEHMALLAIESSGGALIPDPASGRPVGILKAVPSESQLLEKLYSVKVGEIDQACETAITSGFRSSALGAPHSYSSEITDQLNLVDAVSSGQPSLYPCRDENGTRLFREHSAEQLRQVSSDFSAFKLKLLIYSGDLKARLDSALAEGNLVAMEQVVWGSEP